MSFYKVALALPNSCLKYGASTPPPPNSIQDKRTKYQIKVSYYVLNNKFLEMKHKLLKNGFIYQVSITFFFFLWPRSPNARK